MNVGTGMARRPRWIAGLTIALLTTSAMTSGCGLLESEPQAAPTAKEALLTSVPDGSDGPFRFTGKDATAEISGSVDDAAKAMTLTTSVKDPEHGFTMHMAFLVIGDGIWTKITFTGTKGLTGFPKLPKKWLKLDRSRLTNAESVPRYEGVDLGNAGPVIQAATSVRDEGNGRYAGIVDLSSGEAAKVLGEEQTATLGAAAKQVPFTAMVGADKNLASLTLDVPAAGTAKAFQYVVKYRDYGSADKLAVPTGNQAQDAPDLAYEVING